MNWAETQTHVFFFTFVFVVVVVCLLVCFLLGLTRSASGLFLYHSSVIQLQCRVSGKTPK